MFYPAAKEALTQFVADEIPLTILMRALLEYAEWRCPGSKAEEKLQPVCVEQGGKSILPLFADDESIQTAKAAKLLDDDAATVRLQPEEQHKLLGQIDGIWINPGSSPALRIEGEDFDTYKALQEGLEVERCLAGLNENPDFYGILRRYRGYYLILTDGESKLLTIPDQQGRSFAAVFSAWDGVHAAVQKLVAETENKNPAVIPMNGMELFTHLQKLPVEGFLFHWAGPLPAKSFAKSFADEVLEEA